MRFAWSSVEGTIAQDERIGQLSTGKVEAMPTKEYQWLSSEWPEELLQCGRRKASARKLRLLACACCRLLWPLLKDAGSRRAVEASEQYADGTIKQAALRRARASTPGRGASASTDRAATAASSAAADTASYAAEIALRIALELSYPGRQERQSRRLADLVRHIMGSPFQRSTRPECLPASVVQLAESLYAGADCAFALHDALLEAGHVELAEHFQEEAHPKGCWALDLLLGKK